ncbi:hypothetical protein N7517_008192 [Penicillium concentricum]|uniref:Uncharacterized protein n=1 Tax=Penicillium concentricum TaxID=293559 RepID=A0A9W9V3X1_9EURO|nr:uncharacterized protein N7517_008192 [Penicillium concentricum]KAJ5365306.1 hypothetical protein N7517_008192 [Penicillium concentricum]
MAHLLCRLLLGSPGGAQFLFKFGLGSFCPDCPTVEPREESKIFFHLASQNMNQQTTSSM